MKAPKILLGFGGAIAVGCLLGTAVQAAEVDGNAVATLVAPLAITENVALDFGTVASGPAPGTVELNTAGTRIATGDAQIIAAGPGAPGDFTLSGEAGLAYTVSISPTATISDGNGNTMTVDAFTQNSSGTLTGAAENFQVGATLNLGANQPAGNYSTSNAGGAPYTVTVNYN